MQELALHLLDLAQNSLAAGAKQILIEVIENLQDNYLQLVVQDDGRGMTEEAAKRALDPFFTTRLTRKVGLGLPLIKAAAEQAGGGLELTSQPGVGTTVTITFQHDHLDRAPLGDTAMTLVALITLSDHCDFTYRHLVGEREFVLRTTDIKEMLGDVPLNHPEVMVWLRQYIRENEKSLEV